MLRSFFNFLKRVDHAQPLLLPFTWAFLSVFIILIVPVYIAFPLQCLTIVNLFASMVFLAFRLVKRGY